MSHGNEWAVILAGGSGTRLQPLTRMLTGDDRPKQFCSLAGSQSLLADTVARVGDAVERDRMLFVVSKQHERFYRRDLSAVESWRVLEQPAQKGTTAAIAFAIATLQARTERAIVGLFPADHHYADRAAWRRAVTSAFAAADALPGRVVLVGAQATRPETDFGWLQPGARIPGPRPGRKPATELRHVARFWEKPSADIATVLLEGGWLWNTFVTVGRVDAFAELLAEGAPDLWRKFSAIGYARPRGRAVQDAYADGHTSDFSREILSTRTERLAVIELPAAAGWTDLGQPGRALDLLARHNLRRPALRLPPGRAPQPVSSIPHAG